ncbi:MAG: ClpXP protease specificity-enhancing factor SspB [Acidobacteriota bacterium]
MADENPDSLDYAGFLQDALRDMVRRVLEHVAENGMPGEHHFYIGFRTDHPDVRMPGFLRDQYPEEIRIVLQNQFWDLAVDEEAFSVSLSFAAARQRLVVPFAALTEFRDPAANLLLAFEPGRGVEIDSEPEPPEPPERPGPRPVPPPPGSVVQFDRHRKK